MGNDEEERDAAYASLDRQHWPVWLWQVVETQRSDALRDDEGRSREAASRTPLTGSV